jgi:hypothetical protein
MNLGKPLQSEKKLVDVTGIERATLLAKIACAKNQYFSAVCMRKAQLEKGRGGAPMVPPPTPVPTPAAPNTTPPENKK